MNHVGCVESAEALELLPNDRDLVSSLGLGAEEEPVAAATLAGWGGKTLGPPILSESNPLTASAESLTVSPSNRKRGPLA